MGIPFDTVTFDYYQGKPNNTGVKEKTGSYLVKVIWNGNLTLDERNQRYVGTNVVAEIKVLFNRKIPVPNPTNCFVVRQGKKYAIINKPDDIKAQLAFYILGLEETRKASP